ncbi:MAG: helix-turn-helix domain-containing protein [Clostridia bacterium]|nr:helix-turn-helix domain-containing protein [Clostridia bacterium]
MEFGKQFKELRTARGLTQETVAEKLGVTGQAVSRWERGETLPDISLLPEISAYFGVTIDALFALSDDTRLERIQNMIWDVREFDPAVVETERRFLLEKGMKEPDNPKPYSLLADMENRLAEQCHARAELAAREAIRRDPYNRDAFCELSHAFGSRGSDWYCWTHHKEIEFWKAHIKAHPDASRAYLYLMDVLIDDQRFDEAREAVKEMAKHEMTFRVPLYEGNIEWFAGNRDLAMQHWNRMCEQYPDEWMTWLSMGDVYARAGQFEQAIAMYEKAMEIQKPPRMVDALEAIAQVSERMGDPMRGVEALEREIVILREDWHTVNGETVDYVRREIERLKANA